MFLKILQQPNTSYIHKGSSGHIVKSLYQKCHHCLWVPVNVLQFDNLFAEGLVNTPTPNTQFSSTQNVFAHIDLAPKHNGSYHKVLYIVRLGMFSLCLYGFYHEGLQRDAS